MIDIRRQSVKIVALSSHAFDYNAESRIVKYWNNSQKKFGRYIELLMLQFARVLIYRQLVHRICSTLAYIGSSGWLLGWLLSLLSLKL